MTDAVAPVDRPLPWPADLLDPRQLDLELVDAVERANVEGWAPTYVEELADGWILRATPGLDRGRSCHALTPRIRSLRSEEWVPALERIRSFSGRHGIRGGIQVSPLELHGDVIPALVARGWEPIWKVWVMVAERSEVLARGRAARHEGSGAGWILSRQLDADWLSNWQICAPHVSAPAVDAHAATVFAHVAGRAVYGRLPGVASGILTEDLAADWAGLFSLEVRAADRGRGLGRQLLLALVEQTTAPRIYLQVLMDNTVALGLYRSLGFRPVCSYQHLLAPLGWSRRAAGAAGGPVAIDGNGGAEPQG